MKKIFNLLIMATLTTTAFAQVTAQRIGNTTFYSDGTSAQQIGDTTFFSNGTSCHEIGDTIFCN